MLTIIYSVCSVSNLTHSPWAKKKREGNSPAQPKQLEKRSWLAEKREKDPIGIKLGKLAAAASASGAKLEEATSRAEGYSRRNKEVDGAAEILLGCLKEFPAGAIWFVTYFCVTTQV